MADFIVEEFSATRPDGTSLRVELRIGRPVRDVRHDDPPDSNTHVCVVAIGGIRDDPLRIYGEGPMQALHLGLRMVRVYLG